MCSRMNGHACRSVHSYEADTQTSVLNKCLFFPEDKTAHFRLAFYCDESGAHLITALQRNKPFMCIEEDLLFHLQQKFIVFSV